MLRILQNCVAGLIFVILVIGCAECGEITPPVTHHATSADGVQIAYQTRGEGEVSLVFVHGWSCDIRYWQRQVSPLSQRYRVIIMDLAGHGDSGLERKDYTMEAFGQDVVAVLEATDSKQVILVGHSMGGTVILQAARLAPERIIGLIGVDTLHDLGRTPTEEEKQALYAPIAADFAPATKDFVRAMFTPAADQSLVSMIANDMSSAPPEVALSAMRNYLAGDDKELIKDLPIPLKCINSDLWPTNVERNTELAQSFELALLEGYGHFIMLEAPREFNQFLNQMAESIIQEASAKPVE
ncbi:MAG: alpha/beta hydrolase [Planctomycetes bacterium]|nr:alpha/beta hydrolase [Planctomycetota bacterium]